MINFLNSIVHFSVWDILGYFFIVSLYFLFHYYMPMSRCRDTRRLLRDCTKYLEEMFC